MRAFNNFENWTLEIFIIIYRVLRIKGTIFTNIIYS